MIDSFIDVLLHYEFSTLAPTPIIIQMEDTKYDNVEKKLPLPQDDYKTLIRQLKEDLSLDKKQLKTDLLKEAHLHGVNLIWYNDVIVPETKILINICHLNPKFSFNEMKRKSVDELWIELSSFLNKSNKQLEVTLQNGQLWGSYFIVVNLDNKS